MARVGGLRHRIALQAENAVSDGAGGMTDPWANPTTLATVWAEILPANSREIFHAQQLEHVVTHKIRIRYRTGLDTCHRIQFGTRLFNVKSIINVEERNRWLHIMAQEGVAT